MKRGHETTFTRGLSAFYRNGCLETVQPALRREAGGPCRAGRHAAAGMTLVEVLVAVSLMGLLATAMVTALTMGAGSWQAARSRLTLDRRIATANEIFYAEFEGLVPIMTMAGARGESRVPSAPFFQGEPEALRFVSSYSLTQGSRSGLRIVEMQITNSTRGRRILLNELPFRSALDLNSMLLGMDADPVSGRPRLIFTAIQALPTSLIVADELQDCRFAYLELPRNRMDQAIWRSHWADMNRLPGAVRLEMSPSGGEARLKPVTVTALVRARVLVGGGQ